MNHIWFFAGIKSTYQDKYQQMKGNYWHKKKIYFFLKLRQKVVMVFIIGPRQGRYRAHRRPHRAGRYHDRQDHPEGRERSFPGREAPQGHLR